VNNINISKTKKKSNRKQKRHNRLNQYAVAQIAPFDSNVFGVGVPDAMSLPTVKFPARTSFLLQTASALGISYSAGWFSPFVKNAYYTPSAIAANGTITWSAGTTINDPVFT
jgi:hypothetical protein